MGCYNENPEKQHLPIVYHTVTSRVNTRNPDILAIYKECRQKAADYSKPLEIFGILNYNRCVTTETGKEGDGPKQLEIMLLKAILLFIAVSSSLADETPLVQTLPEKQFTASSSYNDTLKAPNVRLTTDGTRSPGAQRLEMTMITGRIMLQWT
ncbi:hypothetical protein ACROYT_G036756 [Oculina patagonica]